MARRETMLGALKWDLIILALIAVALGVAAVLDDPYFRPASSAEATGSRPPDRTEGDVLLLLPDSPAAVAERFDELDCSYGWFNALWQHYGAFATSMNRNLSPEMLAGRSVVIVPRRVASAMPSTGISALAGFARDGGQVVVEQPPEGWELLTGISLSQETRPARLVTSTEGLGVHGPMRKHLPDTPILGDLMAAPQLEPFPNGPTLLEVDDQPGLTVSELGDGWVYTFAFDFGCTVTGLQQGLPDDAMRFGREAETTLTNVSERVAHERLLTSHVPYSDLLELAVFQRLSTARPMPRLWLYPGQYAGALMFSHATQGNTRAAIGYADWARKQEAPSTVFVAPDAISRTEVALLDDTGAELGLLWVRGVEREPLTESVGIGALRPIRQELSLDEQRQELTMKLGADQNVAHVRVEGSLWTNDWSTTFQQLAHANLRLDNSFGPTSADHYGYLFGTGYPYYPIDERGLPLPVLEAPFVLHGANVELERLERMMGNSAAFFHQPLAVSIPSYAMRREPRVGILQAFRKAFDLAEEQDHWVTSIGDFQKFLSARRKSVLTSQWSATRRRLTISVNLLGARTSTLEGGALPGVAFPRTWDGQEIERVVVDGEEISPRRLVTSGTSFERILELGPGRHTVSVFYREPPTKDGAKTSEDDGDDGKGSED
ncbi:MAG: hypothetical protein ACQEVA_10460 [Myxococcota bacterium]